MVVAAPKSETAAERALREREEYERSFAAAFKKMKTAAPVTGDDKTRATALVLPRKESDNRQQCVALCMHHR